jgi:hypothetical protein
LQLARSRPVAGDASVEQFRAQVRADRAGGGIGADATERNGRQQIFDAGEHGEIRPLRQRRAGDFQELLAIEARLLDAGEIRQLIDQAGHQVAGDFDASEIARRIVGEHRQLDRAAESHEIGVDRLERRRPEIRRDGEDAVRADLLRVARKLHGVLDRKCADVDGDWDPAVDHAHRGLGKALALGDRQVERLALVVRPGDRRRAGADVEVEQALEGRQVEAEIVLERRHRALHDASELGCHVVDSVGERTVGAKLPPPARKSKR